METVDLLWRPLTGASRKKKKKIVVNLAPAGVRATAFNQ